MDDRQEKINIFKQLINRFPEDFEIERPMNKDGYIIKHLGFSTYEVSISEMMEIMKNE